MISLSHSFCDVHVPKTGGTSRKVAYRDAGCFDHHRGRGSSRMPEQGIGEAHWPARVYRDTVGPDRWGRIFTFSFWRHPLSLVLSTFHYRRDRLGEENPHKLPSGAEFRPWVMDWLRHHPVDPGEGHAELSANHTYWTDEDGSPLIDRLYSFHDLDAAWADITREVGIDVALPEYNSTGRRRVEDFYDDETRRVVLDRFREDEPILQRFGLSLGDDVG